MGIVEMIIHDTFTHMWNVPRLRKFGCVACTVTFVVSSAALLHGEPATQPATVGTDNSLTRGELLASDDFSGELKQWAVELESGGSVTTRDGALDIDVPAGCTVWLK